MSTQEEREREAYRIGTFLPDGERDAALRFAISATEAWRIDRARACQSESTQSDFSARRRAQEVNDADRALVLLRGCVPIPKVDYDALLAERAKLRRALWEFMEGAAGYGLEDYPTPIATWDAMKALDILGFRDKIGNWTPAAHEFAAEMREKKTP